MWVFDYRLGLNGKRIVTLARDGSEINAQTFDSEDEARRELWKKFEGIDHDGNTRCEWVETDLLEILKREK